MFVTFAFPYMNGPLHLGHLYTMLQGYIAGRRSTNMLMPFGFHCTGMPIYASAMKLKAGDQQVQVTRMLTDMNIPEHEIELFKNPEHWVRYFPERAMQALRKLDLPGLDLTRSFVTTSVNPYFNSFVEWQFTRLHEQGRIYYGRRPCIFSPKDNQPCAAHDRQIGEDATIVNVQTVPEWIALTIPCADKRQKYMDQCTGGYPSERVISRSGDLCIVTMTEQWYISYSEPVWKEETVNYIKNTLIVHDPEVKKNLITAAENLHDWCCSREFGLGTRLPWDDRFLIDSLSDSTIYPIYYNFVDLLQEDMYGTIGRHPVPDINFWNQVFESSIATSTNERIQAFQSRIQAQDLRVSAKDLVNNHLVMMIYNAIAIDRRLLPREYRVNGYVRVDGEKMSKSLGNFVTVEDALETYTKNGLLIALLEAGDGSNDANVRLSDIPVIEKALMNTLSLPMKRPESQVCIHTGPYSQIVVECWQNFLKAQKVGRNREALAYGWRKLAKSYTGWNGWLDYISVNIMRMALSPIIGCSYDLTETDITELLAGIEIDDHVPRLQEYITGLKKMVTQVTNINIKIHHAILDHPGNMDTLQSAFPNITIIRDDAVIHPKRDPYKVKPIIVST